MTFTTRALAAVLLAALPLPGVAQEPVPRDGFFNIAGDPEAVIQDIYGETRGWVVLAGFTESHDFAYCSADMTLPELTWRFGHDAGGQWQIAIKHDFQGETPYGTFTVDGRSSGMTGWGSGGWVVMWPNLGEYEAIAQGNLMEIQLGPVWYQMKLAGTGAAALKVQECVQNRGQVGGGGGGGGGGPVTPTPAAGAAVAMPNVAFRGEQSVGNCQTPYAQYRCLATMLQPTDGFDTAMEITDGEGKEISFVMQTDRADLSQVWVAYDGATYVYMGFWGTGDGTCHSPLPDQTAEVVANLGHDTWELCLR